LGGRGALPANPLKAALPPGAFEVAAAATEGDPIAYAMRTAKRSKTSDRLEFGTMVLDADSGSAPVLTVAGEDPESVFRVRLVELDPAAAAVLLEQQRMTAEASRDAKAVERKMGRSDGRPGIFANTACPSRSRLPGPRP